MSNRAIDRLLNVSRSLLLDFWNFGIPGLWNSGTMRTRGTSTAPLLLSQASTRTIRNLLRTSGYVILEFWNSVTLVTQHDAINGKSRHHPRRLTGRPSGLAWGNPDSPDPYIPQF